MFRTRIHLVLHGLGIRSPPSTEPSANLNIELPGMSGKGQHHCCGVTTTLQNLEILEPTGYCFVSPPAGLKLYEDYCAS